LVILLDFMYVIAQSQRKRISRGCRVAQQIVLGKCGTMARRCYGHICVG